MSGSPPASKVAELECPYSLSLREEGRFFHPGRAGPIRKISRITRYIKKIFFFVKRKIAGNLFL
jgi:hypothetical protein